MNVNAIEKKLDELLSPGQFNEMVNESTESTELILFNFLNKSKDLSMNLLKDVPNLSNAPNVSNLSISPNAPNTPNVSNATNVSNVSINLTESFNSNLSNEIELSPNLTCITNDTQTIQINTPNYFHLNCIQINPTVQSNRQSTCQIKKQSIGQIEDEFIRQFKTKFIDQIKSESTELIKNKSTCLIQLYSTSDQYSHSLDRQTDCERFKSLEKKKNRSSESSRLNETGNELEKNYRATGKCLTLVKLTKSTDESDKFKLNLDQLKDNQISLANSAQMKSKIFLLDNLETDSTDQMDKFYSIFQMLNNSKQIRTITGQINKELQTNSKQYFDYKVNLKSLNTSRTLNSTSTFNGEKRILLEGLKVSNVLNKLKNTEHSKEKLFQSEKGGLKNVLNCTLSEDDGCTYNLRTKRTTNERQTAGKLKRTTIFKTVQFEPFLEHLANENPIYRCLILNHHFELCDRFLNCKCDYTKIDQSDTKSDYSNCEDHQNLNSIKQTSEFVTTINLDNHHDLDYLNLINYNDKFDQSNDLFSDSCELKTDNQFDSESNDLSSIYLNDLISLSELNIANKMYAISGVPNGLPNGQTTNCLTSNQFVQPISAPISVVPVVVSSVVSPKINSITSHQPLLNQNVHFITEKVQIFRKPGERIGLALNFNEASTNCDQKIERVFIQNVNPNSPASNAKGERLLGYLKENDELLCIENRPVNTMSRLDCVECLRDAGNCITLLVRGARVDSSLTRTSTTFENTSSSNSNTLKRNNNSNNNNLNRIPPQIPPRMSTTVLTSVVKDNHQSINLTSSQQNNNLAKCDLNLSSDKMNANNLKNSSFSHSSGNLSTNTIKVSRTTGQPRRPAVAPPLPPRKIPTTVELTVESNNGEPTVKKLNSPLNDISSLNDLSNGKNSEFNNVESTKSSESCLANPLSDVLDQTINELKNNVKSDSDIVLNESNDVLDKNGELLNKGLNKESLSLNLSSQNSEKSVKEPINEEKISKLSNTMDAISEQVINSINKAPEQLVNLQDKCEKTGETIMINKTVNEIKNHQNDEKNKTITNNRMNNSPSIYPTPIQHQSSKNTVSYAANIATNSLQLMDASNSFQSASNHYLDLLNQKNVCIGFVKF